METVVFASRTGVRLELSPTDNPYDTPRVLPTWHALLMGTGLNASAVCPEAGWEPETLADYLADLSERWRGWDGERTWRSEDAELQLTAIHDKRNTVRLRVVIEHASEIWHCDAELELEPGVLEQLAADVRRLSHRSP